MAPAELDAVLAVLLGPLQGAAVLGLGDALEAVVAGAVEADLQVRASVILGKASVAAIL